MMPPLLIWSPSKFISAGYSSLVPFHLYHKTGFTSAFMAHVTSILNAGLTIQELERLLVRNRMYSLHLRRERFNALNRISSTATNTQPRMDDDILWWNQHPSRHSISACFSFLFWERESVYNYHMSSLTAESLWLSCDHTFKSVANIGMHRSIDNKWIKQFKGLFCILNNFGEVVTWKLTKQLAFDEVKNQIELLHNRCSKKGIIIEMFYVDNCCSWRNKLIAIFGPQLKVYLDLFHAVQRISSKISKHHKFHNQCLQSLRLVFRDPADQGSQRVMITPSPEVIQQNL